MEIVAAIVIFQLLIFGSIVASGKRAWITALVWSLIVAVEGMASGGLGWIQFLTILAALQMARQRKGAPVPAKLDETKPAPLTQPSIAPPSAAASTAFAWHYWLTVPLMMGVLFVALPHLSKIDPADLLRALRQVGRLSLLLATAGLVTYATLRIVRRTKTKARNRAMAVVVGMGLALIGLELVVSLGLITSSVVAVSILDHLR